MTGAHAAAMGLDSIFMMCTVTLQRHSTVARRIRADQDGLHWHAYIWHAFIATQTCSAALVWTLVDREQALVRGFQ